METEMWHDNQVADASDRAFSNAMADHTAFSADQSKRDAYVHDRTAAILADKDYHGDLMVSLLEREAGIELLWQLRHSFGVSTLNIVEQINAEVTDIAKRIAESEAEVRFQ